MSLIKISEKFVLNKLKKISQGNTRPVQGCGPCRPVRNGGRVPGNEDRRVKGEGEGTPPDAP